MAFVQLSPVYLAIFIGYRADAMNANYYFYDI